MTWAKGLLRRELGVSGLHPLGASGVVAGLGDDGVGTALKSVAGPSDPVVVVDGAGTSVALLSLLLGASLQKSMEAWSRPSHRQRESTSGLLLVSMATSLVLLTALSSFSAWKERALVCWRVRSTGTLSCPRAEQLCP